MDLKIVQRLVRMMERADLSEIEIDDSSAGLRIHLRRGAEPAAGGVPTVHVVGAAGAAPIVAQNAPAAAAAQPDAPVDEERGTPFPSPMVGTFYRSPSPEADAFVREGAQVGEDSVLCIIEAMKVMNEIKAEMSGEIVQILVENGEPVEYGQPLFLIRPA